MAMQSDLSGEKTAARVSAPARPPFTLPFSKREVRTRRLYQLGLVLVDATLLVLSFVAAYSLRFTFGIGVNSYVVPDPLVYWQLIFVLVPVWLLIFAFLRAYDYSLLLGGTAEYTAIANGCTWGMLAVVALAFFNVELSIARGWLLMSWLISVVLLCAGRLVMRRIAYRARRSGMFVSPALIVGTNVEAASIAAELRNSVASGMSVLGYVTTDKYPSEKDAVTDGDLPILGNVRDLAQVIAATRAEEVIVASTSMSRDELFQVASAITDKRRAKVFLTSGLYDVWAANMEITTRASMPLIGVHRLRLTRTELIMKTLLEGTLIVLALPILLPLFAAIYLAVRLDSPGPVFFRRKVLGVGGRPFDAFKFRSMYVDGNEILARYPEKRAELQKYHKIVKDDPRITRVGALLRKFSLDELPQLINVLLGQMSLVGPRMISPEELDLFGKMRNNLLTVRPGLTGLWQVSGRSDLTYEERVQLDMYYVRNYSIWLDIQILFFQTIPAVLKGRGAY